MKGRESGMPDEAYWASFFDTEAVIETLLGPATEPGNVVEFGCGYGTFTLAAARRTRGIVTALDIEPEMVATVKQKAEDWGITLAPDDIELLNRTFAPGAVLGDRYPPELMKRVGL